MPVEGADKPVIIGEFHWRARPRNVPHRTWTLQGPNERAQAYESYVKSALGNPWIIGAHWFQYGDQAVTGRFDGENYQIGLVDVCDIPLRRRSPFGASGTICIRSVKRRYQTQLTPNDCGASEHGAPLFRFKELNIMKRLLLAILF